MARKEKTTEKEVVVLPARIVLKNPRITEKAANANAVSGYVFDVALTVTKSEIVKAFEMQYKIKPVKVNLAKVQPKAVYSRTKNTRGFTSAGKKAYVYLPKGKTIEII